MTEEEAFPFTSQSFKKFMASNACTKDLDLFISISKAGAAKEMENLPLRVIIPTFVISELRRGFEIDFLIFLPFLIIDIIVASVLMVMVVMTPSVMAVLLFKIIFFVLVDGRYLLTRSLAQSFVT